VVFYLKFEVSNRWVAFLTFDVVGKTTHFHSKRLLPETSEDGKLPTGGWAIALRNFRKYFENANHFAVGVGAGNFFDAKSASDNPTFIQPVSVKIPHPWSNNLLCFRPRLNIFLIFSQNHHKIYQTIYSLCGQASWVFATDLTNHIQLVIWLNISQQLKAPGFLHGFDKSSFCDDSHRTCTYLYSSAYSTQWG